MQRVTARWSCAAARLRAVALLVVTARIDRFIAENGRPLPGYGVSRSPASVAISRIGAILSDV